MQSLLNPIIILDVSFSLRLADRRVTARTTNFVEPCSFQQKKGNPIFSTLCIRHIVSLSKGFLDLMLQAKLSDPIMIGLWARSANNGFDHAALGIAKALLLDPKSCVVHGLLQPFMVCFSPSGLFPLSRLLSSYYAYPFSFGL